MTDDEIRIAVAESVGWKRVRQHWELNGEVAFLNDSPHHRQLADYPKDLNAVHELEKKIKPEDWGTYTDYLCGTKNQLTWWSCAHATALQRCEAYLRTIGKWK